ncbi:MAG: hypothetical protein JST16_00700 [Bdellovibrionales bacterium]|nr:hypothetical protein [Bdellovibrionales bacterium]
MLPRVIETLFDPRTTFSGAWWRKIEVKLSLFTLVGGVLVPASPLVRPLKPGTVATEKTTPWAFMYAEELVAELIPLFKLRAGKAMLAAFIDVKPAYAVHGFPVSNTTVTGDAAVKTQVVQLMVAEAQRAVARAQAQLQKAQATRQMATEKSSAGPASTSRRNGVKSLKGHQRREPNSNKHIGIRLWAASQFLCGEQDAALLAKVKNVAGQPYRFADEPGNAGLLVLSPGQWLYSFDSNERDKLRDITEAVPKRLQAAIKAKNNSTPTPAASSASSNPAPAATAPPLSAGSSVTHSVGAIVDVRHGEKKRWYTARIDRADTKGCFVSSIDPCLAHTEWINAANASTRIK